MRNVCIANAKTPFSQDFKVSTTQRRRLEPNFYSVMFNDATVQRKVVIFIKPGESKRSRVARLSLFKTVCNLIRKFILR